VAFPFRLNRGSDIRDFRWREVPIKPAIVFESAAFKKFSENSLEIARRRSEQQQQRGRLVVRAIFES
jgi:hypothetical protein